MLVIMVTNDLDFEAPTAVPQVPVGQNTLQPTLSTTV